MRIRRTRRLFALLLALSLLVAACVTQAPPDASMHRWWAGLGPVLPHDTFPADCKICHVGDRWDTLVESFRFDHAAQTGVPLRGAHEQAMCLRCHNDRGPVGIFNARGCVGCHEDPHQGDLGPRCTECHEERSWRPVGQIEMHNRTRFPLTGAHVRTACQQCHPGAFVGNFMPTDTECLTCHADDLAATANPPHLGLGWVDNCDRCHIPTLWQQASIR